MSVSTRLYAYLVLPLLLTTGSFLAMNALADGLGDSPLVLGVILCISLLLGLSPILFYRVFIHSQLKPGFARMEDGRLLLPRELRIADILGDRLRSWLPFEQSLSTTVRLHGTTADLLVDIRVGLTLWPDEQGKELASHFDDALPLLERSVQDAVYHASRMDNGFAIALDGSVLLNEEDERVLKSKFLSALETLAIEGLFFSHEASGIHIDRNVTREASNHKTSDTADELCEEELLLDESLLKSAGIV